jgi:hypothetical protein
MDMFTILSDTGKPHAVTVSSPRHSGFNASSYQNVVKLQTIDYEFFVCVYFRDGNATQVSLPADPPILG